MGTRFTGRRGDRPVRRAQESIPLLVAFQDRLRRLGADAGMLKAVGDSWDSEDDDWEMPKAQLIALPDSHLRAMIAAVNDEFREHTTTEEDDQEAQAVAALDRWTKVESEYELLLAQAGGQMKVTDVREWVGLDLDRACAARDAELRHAEPRKTLVAFLEQLLVEG